MHYRITLFFLFLIGSNFVLLAQNQSDATNYYKRMKNGLEAINQASSSPTYQLAAEQIEQIALEEGSKWIPYYHAAYSYIQAVFLSKDKEKIKELINKAQIMINKANELHPHHTDIVTLQGLLYEANIMIDPVTMTNEYIRKAVKEYDHARFLDKNNPRPYFLIGKVLYNLPGKYSNKKSACEHFEKAAFRFKNYQVNSEFSPNWGEESNQRMLEKCQ